MEGITVGNTRKLDRLGEDGQSETGFRVSYKTDKGASGVLFVPEADFTKERLPGILEAERDRANLAFEIANEE